MQPIWLCKAACTHQRKQCDSNPGHRKGNWEKQSSICQYSTPEDRKNHVEYNCNTKNQVSHAWRCSYSAAVPGQLFLDMENSAHTRGCSLVTAAG